MPGSEGDLDRRVETVPLPGREVTAAARPASAGRRDRRRPPAPAVTPATAAAGSERRVTGSQSFGDPARRQSPPAIGGAPRNDGGGPTGAPPRESVKIPRVSGYCERPEVPGMGERLRAGQTPRPSMSLSPAPARLVRDGTLRRHINTPISTPVGAAR